MRPSRPFHSRPFARGRNGVGRSFRFGCLGRVVGAAAERTVGGRRESWLPSSPPRFPRVGEAAAEGMTGGGVKSFLPLCPLLACWIGDSYWGRNEGDALSILDV